MVELNLNHIYKKYPNASHYAVEDFDLDIKDKEFIVFVGPSGCGKSTTLRMVAGLEDITEGELKIDGEVVNDKAPKDRDIAMVFQNYALYPHMTVYDNMAFGLKLRKYKKDDCTGKICSCRSETCRFSVKYGCFGGRMEEYGDRKCKSERGVSFCSFRRYELSNPGQFLYEK